MPDTRTFEETLASLIEGAERFKEEHGSVEVIVGPNSPFAKARVERAGGFPINVDEITLVSRNRDDDDIKVDGDLIYYRAIENDGVTVQDAVQSIGWLDSFGEIEWHSCDWSGGNGSVYLEGDKGDVKMTLTMEVRSFTSFREPDWGNDDEDLDDEDEG